MSALLEKIGWVLIHFLWEGTLLGMVAWVGCLSLKSFPASARYNFLCCCLLACGLTPILTWSRLGSLDLESQTKLIPFSLRSFQPASTGSSEPYASAFSLKAIPGPAFNYIRLNWILHEWLQVVAVTWVAFASVLVFRILCDYRELSRLISSGRPIPRRQVIQRKFVRRLSVLARRIGIKRNVLLMESAFIDVPSVVGWVKPIVLVPVAFLGSMPADQIEAILAHELAHVRRCDYFVNVLQILIETLLFYHPAVRWISRAIREERENCCDDIAITMAGDKVTFVSALASLAERSLPLSASALAVDGGSLIKRVRRVLGADQPDEIWGVVLARQAYVGMLLGVVMIGLCSAICFTTDHSSVTKHVDKGYLTKALVSAATVGDVPSMEILIHEGADINQNVPPYSENALFAATTRNHMAAVDLLLRNGAFIDAKTDWGMRAMDWALATGSLSMVKLLHDNGVQISPSAWAAATDDTRQLKSLGAGGLLTNFQKDEMMKYAVSMGHLDAVQFLEKMTGKPVAGKFLADAASAGNISMMAYILKQGANIRTDEANAMVQVVLFYDQPEAAKFLLQHGADPNQFTHWRKYLLSEAQNARMVKVLLAAGANPNCEDRWGTPLSAAPDAESVRLLVRYGANLHPHLRNGVSLIESTVNYDRHDRPDVLRELIRLGATFELRGNGVGALALAAARNKVQTVKCLLDLGVSPNAFLDAPYWQTSVMRGAVIGSSIDAAKLLLEQGGDVLGDSRDGVTLSSLALLSGNGDMANLLCEGGARDIGDLPLAIASGDLKEVSYLITNGANVNQKDQAGHTPLFYALRWGQFGIANLLIQHGAVVHGVELTRVTDE